MGGPMRRAGLVGLALLAITLGFGGPFAAFGALRAGSPAATPATSPPVDCTVWRDSPDAPLGPDVCTASPSWWTVWSTCPVTPIHAERWQPSSAIDTGLERIPWVRAEPAGAGVVGHLFYGNRPLHAGNHFPDGAAAKVLWEFDRPIAHFSLRAVNLWQPGAPISIDPPPVAAAGGTQWPSYVNIPTAGCWRVDLHADDGHGATVAASATFIVVDG